MGHLWAAALSLAFGVFVELQAQANPCPPSDLARRVAALPKFIVVPQDNNPRQALVRALGCDLPPPPVLRGGQLVNPKTLVGHSVYSSEGHYFGMVTDTLVNRETGMASSLVALGSPKTNEHKNVAVAVDELSLKNGSLELSDVKTAQIVNLPLDANSNYEQSWWSKAQCSFEEFCGLISTKIDSVPPGATVYYAERSSGTTEITGLLSPSDVRSLRIELAGYKPCLFQDGVYQKANGDDYATFYCKLKPAH
jgi:sporulation protein YlmC with PRC-barrel domain